MNFLGRVKHFLIGSRRVLRVTRKPNREEFLTVVKASGLGILFIGLVGFILQIGKFLIIG